MCESEMCACAQIESEMTSIDGVVVGAGARPCRVPTSVQYHASRAAGGRIGKGTTPAQHKINNA